MNKKQLDLIFAIGALLTSAGAIMRLLDVENSIYLFGIGSIIVIAIQAKIALHKTDDLRQQRLTRMGFTSSLLLGLGTYFMYVDSNAWVITLLIYALTIFFLSFRS
jgi:hypothetical protein